MPRATEVGVKGTNIRFGVYPVPKVPPAMINTDVNTANRVKGGRYVYNGPINTLPPTNGFIPRLT